MNVVDKTNKGNKVTGIPQLSDRTNVTFEGEDLELVIGKNVKFLGVNFKLVGRNSKIIIEDGVVLRGNFTVSDGSLIKIGSKSIFNWNADFWAIEGASVIVGSDCLFSRVFIKTSDGHSIFDRFTGERINFAQDVKIGNHVWLAQDAVILKGSVIGSGSVIGMGAVVSSEIEEHSIAVGVPAKVIRRNIDWDTSKLDVSPYPKLDRYDSPFT